MKFILDSCDLTSEKATHIIRIIQELLNNAVKYVQSGEICISVSLEFGNVNIFYHDNGPGFDVSDPGIKGIGLSIIKERAKLLGGKAVLNTAPLKGTHWIVAIPAKE